MVDISSFTKSQVKKNSPTFDILNRPFSGKPSEKIGIGGFTLYAMLNETVNRSSRVPTSWLEDGSFAQDQIIIDPLTITISGEVSDIYVERDPSISALKRAQGVIGSISTYLPTRSQSQVQRINSIINGATDKLRSVDRAINTGKQALGFFGIGTGGKTNRELFIDAVELWTDGRQRIKINTKYRTYDDMVITSIAVTRNNEHEALSFNLSAQKIRFAETTYSDINEYFKKPSDGIDGKTDSAADKGPQKPKSIDESLLYTTYTKLKTALSAAGYILP